MRPIGMKDAGRQLSGGDNSSVISGITAPHYHEDIAEFAKTQKIFYRDAFYIVTNKLKDKALEDYIESAQKRFIK